MYKFINVSCWPVKSFFFTNVLIYIIILVIRVVEMWQFYFKFLYLFQNDEILDMNNFSLLLPIAADVQKKRTVKKNVNIRGDKAVSETPSRQTVILFYISFEWLHDVNYSK